VVPVTTIRAIPRTYAGVRFRSTLEADWAYNLDLLSISWQYEPEGVQLPSGSCYRPDFYLPSISTWLEIKGPHDERVEKIAEFGTTVWGERRDRPDQLVLIGRPAERGVMVVTDPGGSGHPSNWHTQITAAKCRFCKSVQFYLPWRWWPCRSCDSIRWSGGGEPLEVLNGPDTLIPLGDQWRQLSWK
jgi:hypothetical protein